MVADPADAFLPRPELAPSRLFHHIAIHWSSNGANRHTSHYVAKSRTDAFFVAAYYVGWYQSRECEVRDVVITTVPTGTAVPLPTFLRDLRD